jgi:type I restriction enzyme S subunit
MNKLISTINRNSIPYQLNNNWTWYKWGDLIESYQQGLIRSNSELNEESGTDYFKMNFINEDGSYTFNSLPKTFATKEEIEKFKINSGDFFINVRNSKELVGKSCVIYGVDRDIMFNHMLVRIKHKDYISGSFINAYLNTNFGKKLLDTCKKGTTTVIALYQKDIYELPIPIPKKSILESIDRIYNDINKKIELNNRINSILEQMAQTLYNYWFVQFDFPNKESKPYKSFGGKMEYNKVLKREIPVGWEVKKLEKIADINKKQISSRTNWSFVNYLDTSNITDNHIQDVVKLSIHDAPSRAKRIVDVDDVIFSTVRPIQRHYGILKNCVENMVVSTGFAVLSHKTKKIYNNFIYTFLSSDTIVEYLHNIAQNSVSSYPSINPDDILNLLICVPQDDSMLQVFSEKMDSFYKKVHSNQQQNQQLSGLRDWLLPMLMNGQVKVDSTSMSTRKNGSMAT